MIKKLLMRRPYFYDVEYIINDLMNPNNKFFASNFRYVDL